jgi:hypothetical protein
MVSASQEVRLAGKSLAGRFHFARCGSAALREVTVSLHARCFRPAVDKLDLIKFAHRKARGDPGKNLD